MKIAGHVRRAFFFASFLVAPPVQADADIETCLSQFRLSLASCPLNGIRPTRSAIEVAIDRHQDWLKIPRTTLAKSRGAEALRKLRANFCGADLSEVDLSGLNLSGAKFYGANLEKANLSSATAKGSNFTCANMTEINLVDAKLQNAKIQNANIGSADLSQADLTNADLNAAHLKDSIMRGVSLWWARLQEAELYYVNLQKANMDNADLTNADLYEADLRGVSLQFAKVSGTQFNRANLYGASMLGVPVSSLEALKGTIDSEEFPVGLASVRENFKAAGDRETSRYLTYLIQLNRNESSDKPVVERWFNILLFEFTSKWGYEPGQPIRLLAYLFLVGIVVYLLPVRFSQRLSRFGAVYLVRPEGHLSGYPATAWLARDATVERLHANNWFKALGISAYFSLLSCFNIGWRDMSVGVWLSKIQTREFTLRGSGWVRVFSGIQSLVGLYLLGLWVFVYFSNPFE